MDIALTAQLFQNIFTESSNRHTATVADDIRSLFGLACGALIAAGEAFQQTKQDLGRRGFSDWLNENGFVSADTNKLIKLFECFGEMFGDLTTVNPLSLMRLLAPNCEEARNSLFDMIEEYRETNEIVTSQEVETVRKVHSPQRQPRATKQDENKSVIKMVGNQPGGTGIFRLEVKNHELANQLDTEWKQSGCSADRWMQFMLASTRKIQEIAQVVLGRKINDLSELSELNVLINQSQYDSEFVGVELEIDEFGQILPCKVAIVLDQLRNLDESIARCSNAIAKRMYREERMQVLSQLEILAAEYELDIESLVWRGSQELVPC